MAQSCFMANGVEAGSALAALQGVLGFERAADMLKALRGTCIASPRKAFQDCACRSLCSTRFAGAYFGSSGWQDTFGCSRHGAAFGPIAEMSEYREDFRAERKPPGPPSLTLLYRSSGLVAVSKPAGFSTEDVLRCLSAKLKTRITQVSRLDLPTSGVLLAAVGSATSPQAWWLLAQFAGRLISKTYLCLCFGKAPAGAEREVSSPLLTTHSKSGKSGYSRTQAGPYKDARELLGWTGCNTSCVAALLCASAFLHFRYLHPVCHQRLATRFWLRSQGSICSKKDWPHSKIAVRSSAPSCRSLFAKGVACDRKEHMRFLGHACI